mmetsp:Transcript_88758/g.255989  ORF Transcript_88758/g.255989 Transcript_88758/m.255989 type:complete len:202 (+) Transcript_88758:602-1207(+)
MRAPRLGLRQGPDVEVHGRRFHRERAQRHVHRRQRHRRGQARLAVALRVRPSRQRPAVGPHARGLLEESQVRQMHRRQDEAFRVPVHRPGMALDRGVAARQQAQRPLHECGGLRRRPGARRGQQLVPRRVRAWFSRNVAPMGVRRRPAAEQVQRPLRRREDPLGRRPLPGGDTRRLQGGPDENVQQVRRQVAVHGYGVHQE